MTKTERMNGNINKAFDFLKDIVKTPSKADAIEHGDTVQFVDDSHAIPLADAQGVTIVTVKREFEVA